MTRDPLGFVDGPAFYAAWFVPNHSDPSGLECDKKKTCLEENFPEFANGTMQEPMTCKVKICDRPINADPTKTFGHVYILVEGPDKTYDFTGFPVDTDDGKVLRLGVFPWKVLTGANGKPVYPYDWPKDDAAKKEHACNEYELTQPCSKIWCCMFDLGREMKEAGIPYTPLPTKGDLKKGANSNSAARWMSEKCLKGNVTGGKTWTGKPINIPADFLPYQPTIGSYPNPGWDFPLPKKF